MPWSRAPAATDANLAGLVSPALACRRRAAAGWNRCRRVAGRVLVVELPVRDDDLNLVVERNDAKRSSGIQAVDEPHECLLGRAQASPSIEPLRSRTTCT